MLDPETRYRLRMESYYRIRNRSICESNYIAFREFVEYILNGYKE